MIDFIKIATPYKEALEAKIKNDFSDTKTICSLDYFNGEAKYPCHRYFKNMEVRITDTCAIVRNSIHKYFNIKNGFGDNNYTDFSYSNLCEAFRQFQNDLNEDIEDYNITNLELGINIGTTLNPKLMLDNNFIMFNFDEFNQKELFRSKGMYKQYNRSSYYIKIYDKGLHYSLPYNVFRIELKATDSKLLKENFGISKVKDIYDKDKLQLMFNFLMDRYEELNIIDTYNDTVLTPQEKTEIDLSKSPSYWREMRNTKSKSYYYNKRLKSAKLLEQHNLATIKDELRASLKAKFQVLIDG